MGDIYADYTCNNNGLLSPDVLILYSLVVGRGLEIDYTLALSGDEPPETLCDDNRGSDDEANRDIVAVRRGSKVDGQRRSKGDTGEDEPESANVVWCPAAVEECHSAVEEEHETHHAWEEREVGVEGDVLEAKVEEDHAREG